jgi:Domain of unknown function (DU1801)
MRKGGVVAEMKTKQTKVSALTFLRAIEHPQRRADGMELLKLMREISGEPAKMWGPSIVGFGTRRYAYASGRTGEICTIGFSPRKASLVLYCGATSVDKSLLAKLGKHKTGAGCLYITKLDDIDRTVLRKLVRAGFTAIKNNTTTTAC